jgi:hypothetical protein
MTLVLLALMQITSIWIPSLELRAHGRENEQVRLDLNELGDTEAVRSPSLQSAAEVLRLRAIVSHQLPLSPSGRLKGAGAD